VAGSIDRRTFCLFPFRFDTARSEKHQPSRALPSVLTPSSPCAAAATPPTTPFAVYFILIWNTGEAKVVVPRSFFPLFRLASPPPLLPSRSLRPPDGTHSLSSLGLHEEVGHLHPSTLPSFKAEGAKSSERSERAT
jgi:hypothetical protein